MAKTNKTHTLQVRLTEMDYKYLTQSAYALGSTPSKLVRQMIQIAINASMQAERDRRTTPPTGDVQVGLFDENQ